MGMPSGPEQARLLSDMSQFRSCAGINSAELSANYRHGIILAIHFIRTTGDLDGTVRALHVI
jgi:hypothetical protein